MNANKINKKNQKTPPTKTVQGAIQKAVRKVVKDEGNRVRRKIVEEHIGENAIIDRIALSIAAPGEGEVLRWAPVVGQKKTAIAKPKRIIESTWGQNTSGSYNNSFTQLTQSEGLAFLFRSQTNNCVIFDQNPTGKTSSYQYLFSQSSNGGVIVAPDQQVTVDAWLGAKELPVVMAVPVEDYKPHGPFLYGKTHSHEDGVFMWHDLGHTLEITSSASGPDTSDQSVVQFEMDYYGPAGFEPNVYTITATLSNNGTQISTILLPSSYPTGYYTVRMIIDGSQVTGAVSTYTFRNCVDYGVGQNFCQLTLPNFDGNIAANDGLRILGLSLMYTNTAAVLNLGGSCSAVQVGTGYNWTQFIEKGKTLSMVATMNESSTMNLSKGIYGFLKPTELTEFDYQNPIEKFSGSSIVTEVDDDIDRVGSFIVIALSCPDPQGCIGYFTVRDNIEYMSQDTWRDLERPAATYEEWLVALKKVEAIPQFHENPVHIKDIWNFIKNAGSEIMGAIRDYGPAVLDIAKLVGKVL